jgi:thymidylate kinase
MGGRLKVTYVSEISCAINNHPEKFHYFLNDTFGEDVAKKIWQLLLSGQVDAALNIGKSARRKTWSRFFKKKLLLTTKGTVVHFSREIFRRSFRSPASMISVVGPDGVGKTTFIELLKQELSRTLVKDADAILVNHFRPNILPNIKKLLSGKNYDPSTEDFTNPHRAKPAGVFSSFIRLTYYWLDYVLGYWLDTRRKCAQQNVFIFDRYFYDFIVDPRRSRINLPAWIRKAFLALTPQPDLVLFLDCDADIVFARKQELSRDEIERQLVEYRSLAMAFPQRFVRLDAQQPPEVSCHQALVHIIERSFRLL